MDRSLNQLFTAIHEVRTRLPNPLYCHLPTTFTVNLADLPISIILSPKSRGDEDEWMRWEAEEASSISDDDSEDDWKDVPKTADFRVEVWRTLLLVDEDTVSNAEQISRALVGLGVSDVETDVDGSVTSSPLLTTGRRDSKELTSAEEDEGLLMKALIEACDVTKR